MKIALQDNRRYILRFDKGEDVIAGIEKFMVESNSSAATWWGIGSCSEVELGYYNSFMKEYRKKPFAEDFEIISLTGNGSMLSGKPAVHAHGMFGRTDFTAIGGHVFKLIVSATCEVFLIKLDGQLGRAQNPDFNLNLLA